MVVPVTIAADLPCSACMHLCTPRYAACQYETEAAKETTQKYLAELHVDGADSGVCDVLLEGEVVQVQLRRRARGAVVRDLHHRRLGIG